MAILSPRLPDARPRGRRIALVVLLSCASVFAGLGATNRDLWGPAALVLGVIVAGTFVLVRPRAALMISFFLVMVAATKFRDRDPTALLVGDIDTQVVFELASYAMILLAALINAIALSGRRQVRAFGLAPVEALLGGYLLLAGVSVMWSVDAHVTAARAMQLGILYALCLVGVRALGPVPALRTLTVAVVAYVLLASAMALSLPWARYAGNAFSWFTLHPGVAGTFAGTAALLLLSIVLFADHKGEHPITHVLRWSCIGVLLVILIATHHRTPIFAFVAAALTLWTRKHLRPWMAVLLVSISFAVAVAGLHFLGASYGNAKVDPETDNPIIVYLFRGETGEQFLGLSGRVELWDYISSLVHDRPLLGYGYIASRSILLDRFPWAGSSHGAAAEVLLDLGIVGLMLMGAATGRTVLAAFSAPLSPRGEVTWGRAAVLGLLVFLLVNAVAGDSLAGAPGYEVFLFLLAAIALGHLRMPGGTRDA